MRRIMFMMAAIAAMIVSAHTTETKLFDNTYVTLKGGVTALMHPGCNGYENLGHTFEAATSLQIGKWITPHWGMAIDGTNGWTNGSKYGKFQDEYAVNYVTVSALAKYRIPVGKFDFVVAGGPSWIHGFKKDATDHNDIGTKMQLEFNYNLNNRIAFNLVPELNYNFTCVNGNQPRFDARNAWYGLMAGVTYKFGNEFTECNNVYTQNYVDELNAKINELRNQPATIIEKKVVVEKEITVNNADEYVVFFENNSSVLSYAAKETLNKVTGSVSVKGCASENGTEARNLKLSKERATVVANYLKNRGVNVLNAEGAGVTGNRVAIVTVK